MSVTLGVLLEVLDDFWPISGADEWDAPGLISGTPNQTVSRILMTVDVTSEVIDEAIDGGFDLIIAHHPLLLRGIKSVSEQTGKGSILARAIRNNIAIYAAHTNADIVERGVSQALAQAFGLTSSSPIVVTGEGIGHGRVGILPEPTGLGEFAKRVARSIPSTASGVRVAGSFDASVSRVALCGGAGDSFIDLAYATGADVYVTSDLRHHPAQEILERAKAEVRDFALIDISHWAAEWLWLNWAADDIHDRFASIQVVVSEIRTDPWDFAVTQ